MTVLEIFFYIFLLAIFFTILYFVVKAAVRNGIKEAHDEMNRPKNSYGWSEGKPDGLAMCPKCGEKYSCYLPKCPFCEHSPMNL